MNRNQRIALAEKDLQVKDLAQLLDKHANYVSNVLSGRHKPAALRKEICNILAKPETHLWPDDKG
jgi:hypothetical protein